MTQEHPITPSEDQIMLWCKQWNCIKEPGPIHKWLAIQAARWGADQELEACCEWFFKNYAVPSSQLRAIRRPNPPSLKEQALALLDKNKTRFAVAEEDVIRLALKSLPD